MHYIESFRDGERISEVYLCKSKSSATTKAGKEYENVILTDKTGQIDSKIWDPNSGGIGDFDAESALKECVKTANLDDYRQIGLYKNMGYIPYDVVDKYNSEK